MNKYKTIKKRKEKSKMVKKWLKRMVANSDQL